MLLVKGIFPFLKSEIFAVFQLLMCFYQGMHVF